MARAQQLAQEEALRKAAAQQWEQEEASRKADAAERRAERQSKLLAVRAELRRRVEVREARPRSSGEGIKTARALKSLGLTFRVWRG